MTDTMKRTDHWLVLVEAASCIREGRRIADTLSAAYYRARDVVLPTHVQRRAAMRESVKAGLVTESISATLTPAGCKRLVALGFRKDLTP